MLWSKLIKLSCARWGRHIRADHSVAHYSRLRERTKNDEGDAIEPGAQISAAPQQNGELDRVNQILDQEKTTQLYERGIHVGNGNFRHLLDLLLRNDNVEFQIFPKNTIIKHCYLFIQTLRLN